MTSGKEEIYQKLCRHLDESWPDRSHHDFKWTLGPVTERLPRFSVRRVDPLGPGDGYLYLSVGAFESGAEPLREFFIMSAHESPRHVETLAMVCHFHSIPAHRLQHGSIVNLGRPWAEGSNHQHLLISWPYAFDKRAATCMTFAGDMVYLWLVPISEREADVVRRCGVQELEERLESSGANLLDPLRPSVY
ncbi:suppressor of fused domain protein [Micromonospora sp. B11E3]|uniref:suppressor of fused domain protein n=1 Tax=Micromonospora sp. B11E3 TaxID=3153562 RepID=UPI00325C79AF